MNGAIMKNFVSPDQPFASALVGGGPDFVSEVDESDGTIVLYHPKVAVLNNVTLDHKSLEELRHLFGDFAAKAERVVINLDDDEARLLAAVLPADRLITYSFKDEAADFYSPGLDHVSLDQSTFVFRPPGTDVYERVLLRLPGLHNAQNALAAIAAVHAIGIAPADAARAMREFTGLRRRFEIVGKVNGVTVIDDFGHNPDKIAATLRTLNGTYDRGRLLIFFQPHGYGPLRQMKEELILTFAREMASGDVLIMPDPVYYGGTTNREIGSADIVTGVTALGRTAEHIAEAPPERSRSTARLLELAQQGDRIIIMGARDDTLSQFAQDLVERLAEKETPARQ
jgi:UDP-N-acetylmuramate--alanine ligase